MKKLTYPALFTIMLMFIFSACTQQTKLSLEGWTLSADPETSTLVICKDGLDTVAYLVQLNLAGEDHLQALSGWTVKQASSALTIQTSTPESSAWTFTPTGEGIKVTCSAASAVLTGMAPADENRIPARVSDQDNGIMYTQMGLVSATNIHHLFDRATDIMIGFGDGSQLSRNPENNRIMDFQVPVSGGIILSATDNYYTDVLGLASHQKTDFKPVYQPISDRFRTAPTGWSSWYCYYMSPDEEDLVAETDALAEKLEPYGLDYVQLDAAYTRGAEANWLNWNKEMYPHGGKWWFDHIKEKGLKPALWLNAYGDNYAKPSMADKYPEDFYLRDSTNHLSGACCTADTTVVRLDYTNPAVIEKHLKPLFNTLVNDWGLAYLKDAGWGTWMDYYEENRKNAFNPDLDSREAYRNVQAAIREIMGKDNYIVGCAMHEIGVGFGFYDGSRTGGDDYAQWTGEGHWSGGMQTFFNSLFGANWLNGICWWCDPDDVMTRDPLTMDEATTIVSSISLSGQAYIISDFIADFSKERLQDFLHSKYSIGWARQYPDKVRALPDKKLQLYRETMPAMPIRAMDLYPFRTDPACCPKPESFPRALDLKVNAISGMYDVVALYNWGDENSKKTLSLHDDLGLEPGEYLVFDYWNKVLTGKTTDTINQEVLAHGTAAMIIRKRGDHPQLLATSRHLTAAYSLTDLSWDKAEKTLSGVSKTVAGDPYTLYLFVPEGYTFNTSVIDAEEVSQESHSNGLLEIHFTGNGDAVSWKVLFK